MKLKHLFIGILLSILTVSAYSQVDTLSSIIIGNEIFLEKNFEDIRITDNDTTKSSIVANCDSIIQEYHNSLSEIEQRKSEIEKMDSEVRSMREEKKKMDSLLFVYDEKGKDLSYQLANLQYKFKEDSSMFSEEIDELRTNEYNLKLINDTLAKLNQEYRNQLNDKNRLLEEKIRIFQEKELLFAEKEQVYKEAINSSNLDKVKIEGLVNASNEKIVGKTKEIDLLQKSINEKESAMASKDLTLSKISEEKDMYYKMADTLRSKLVEAEKQILRTNEELKYTKKRAEEAEAKIAAATNKKKKVRVLQGIAMRFFPTPTWDIVPRDIGIGGYENIIINRNSSKVEFDFVTGASVMLIDLTKPEAKFTSDIGVYVGFGGANMFKNFYFGGAYRFLDFFSVSAGVNVAEYTLLAKDFNKEGDALKPGWSIQTTKEWKVTPFICLSLDLEFLSYMGKK
ncbi:MAG: hypothetical protein WC135_03020 [Bacteroidales bacterium]